jgi:hypothetical protein
LALKPVAFLAFSAFSACAACSKSAPPPPRTEPWRAQPSSTENAAEQSPRVRYALSPASRTVVELRTREAAISGVFRLARGEVTVAPNELAAARGEVSVDLGSLILHGEDSLEEQRYTAQAQDWLDIGASRPEAERSRLRWARFTLTDLTELTAEAARTGRVSKTLPKLDPDAPALLAAEDASAGTGTAGNSEFRSVDCMARGQLILHGFKAEHSAPVRVSFEYAAGVSPNATPARVTIRSRRPLVVTLKAHDIKPRDSAGVFIAHDLGLLGTKVATEARVWIDWILEASH